jgi:hypothetical protein
MYRQIALFCAFICSSTHLFAHEMVPAYPKFGPSYMSDVSKTTVKMFNKRRDVEWYEIGVFDQDRNSIPFVSKYKIMQLQYLDHATVDIYVRNNDLDRVVYICSRSKLRKEQATKTLVASVICSKVKQ